MTIWDDIAAERRRLADDLETLTDDQWSAPSQCEAWTVGELATHLIVPFSVSKPRMMVTLLRHRGSIDRAALDLTARVGARISRTEVIAALRANADNRWTPPFFGPGIPLSEIVVHGQDIRRPLGLEPGTPEATVARMLDTVDDENVRRDYARRLGV